MIFRVLSISTFKQKVIARSFLIKAKFSIWHYLRFLMFAGESSATVYHRVWKHQLWQRQRLSQRLLSSCKRRYQHRSCLSQQIWTGSDVWWSAEARKNASLLLLREWFWFVSVGVRPKCKDYLNSPLQKVNISSNEDLWFNENFLYFWWFIMSLVMRKGNALRKISQNFLPILFISILMRMMLLLYHSHSSNDGQKMGQFSSI